MKQDAEFNNKDSTKAGGKYPVQQVAYKEPLNEQVVKDAVREINPDEGSMISRG